MKQEPRSLPKVGKQHLSKEHSITYLPTSPSACDSEQGPRVSLPRDPVARRCPWGTQARLFAFRRLCIKGKAHAEPWLWRLPLHGNSVGHPLRPARDRQTAFRRLCGWEMTKQVYSSSSVGQDMCARPWYWLGNKVQDGALDQAHQRCESYFNLLLNLCCLSEQQYFPNGSSEK